MKISDPGKRQERVGPLHEGRELHLLNVDWKATENEIREAFSRYGKVEKVRIPRDVGGKSKGFAFVVFSNKVMISSRSWLGSRALIHLNRTRLPPPLI